MSALLEQLKQLLIKLAALLGFPPKPPIIPDEVLPPPAPQVVSPIYSPPSQIPFWSEAIRVAEGWSPTSRSFRNHNPGNMHFSSFTMSLGAIGKDDMNFCIFPDDEKGMFALREFLTAACLNQLRDYHDKNLEQFTNIYAGNPPPSYLQGICAALKVDKTIPIKQLL